MLLSWMRGAVARFRSPRRRAGSFSLHAQRKVTKRKGTLASRSPDILSVDCASGLRGSLTAHPVPTTNARASVHAPLRAFSSTRSPGRKGNPGRAQARALLRAQSGAHPCKIAALALAFALLCSRSPGPFSAGGRRTKRPAGWARWIAPIAPSVQGCTVGATRPTFANPRGFFPRAALWGVLLFGDFLLDKQEKVTRSPPRRAEPLRKHFGSRRKHCLLHHPTIRQVGAARDTSGTQHAKRAAPHVPQDKPYCNNK